MSRTDELSSMPKLDLLQRALDAEDERDALLARIADLESRFKSALNADPTTASRALSWIGRAENAEALVREVLRYVEQRSVSATDLPGGWVARAEAQIKAVDILVRDMRELTERPDETWADYTERVTGRRSVIRDP